MAYNDLAGQRFMKLRRWLDVSHRAIGRLAQENGIPIHESLWGTWEQRPELPENMDNVKGILKVVATRLEGDAEKSEALMVAALKGEKDLPKKPAAWLRLHRRRSKVAT